MQGTIASFETERHTGTLLLDDGSPLDFDEAAFAASGLRLLRVGQRVRVHLGDDGAVTKITIPTLS